jgi:hypothetical protein
MEGPTLLDTFEKGWEVYRRHELSHARRQDLLEYDPKTEAALARWKLCAIFSFMYNK